MVTYEPEFKEQAVRFLRKTAQKPCTDFLSLLIYSRIHYANAAHRAYFRLNRQKPPLTQKAAAPLLG